MLLNGLFHSKLLYGAPLWAGAPIYLKNKIQHLQLEACRLANGFKSLKWSKKQLLDSMKWTNVQSLVERASATLIHSIIHFNEPKIIAAKMNIITNTDIQNSTIPRITRTSGPLRLGPRPKGVGRTRLS